jgi:hypothetical protein
VPLLVPLLVPLFETLYLRPNPKSRELPSRDGYVVSRGGGAGARAGGGGAAGLTAPPRPTPHRWAKQCARARPALSSVDRKRMDGLRRRARRIGRGGRGTRPPLLGGAGRVPPPEAPKRLATSSGGAPWRRMRRARDPRPVAPAPTPCRLSPRLSPSRRAAQGASRRYTSRRATAERPVRVERAPSEDRVLVADGHPPPPSPSATPQATKPPQPSEWSTVRKSGRRLCCEFTCESRVSRSRDSTEGQERQKKKEK